MIKSSFTISNPKELDMTMVTEMSIEEWIMLKNQLNKIDEHYYSPISQFIRSVNDLINQANKSFKFEEIDEDKSNDKS